MKVVGIILGVLTVIVGALAMFMPFRTFLTIGWVLGAVLLVNGIEMFFTGIFGKKKSVTNAILGVIFMIGGAILLVSGIQRALTDLVIVICIGICIVCFGATHLIMGLINKESKSSKIIQILCGVLSMIVGILALTHPVMTMVSAGIMIGANLLVQGISTITLFAAYKKAE